MANPEEADEAELKEELGGSSEKIKEVGIDDTATLVAKGGANQGLNGEYHQQGETDGKHMWVSKNGARIVWLAQSSRGASW